MPNTGKDCYDCFKTPGKKICSIKGVAYCCDETNYSGNCKCSISKDISAMKFCPLDTSACGNNFGTITEVSPIVT